MHLICKSLMLSLRHKMEKVSAMTKNNCCHSTNLFISPSMSFSPLHLSALNATISLSKEDETASLSFTSPLTPSAGELHLQFNGILNDKMKGFYRSKYTSPDGEERYAATTQFEPTDARRAFPCWDEPALKATFDITLVV